MPCLLKECMVLGVCHRIPINIVCIKVKTARRQFGSKYLVYPPVSQKDMAELLLGNSHGKLTFGHQHHLGFIYRAHNSVRRMSRAELSAYIPAVHHYVIPLLKYAPQKNWAYLLRRVDHHQESSKVRKESRYLNVSEEA